MPQKLMFARLVKADEARREVSGVMVAEVPDKTGEIFDYESSKPFFKAWNRQFAKATSFLPEDERSLGNVREMHKPSAVGKLIACSYDDAEKSIFVTAHIDDDAAWRKCAKGIYTGFSIGGDYVDTWKDETDPALTRYTAKPAEASIVDNPAVPVAEFELVRADGSRAMCKFAKAGAESTSDAGLGDDEMADKEKEAADLEAAKLEKAEKDKLEKARHSKATMESLNAIKAHHGKITKAVKAIGDHHETISDCAKSMGEHISKVLEGSAGQLQSNENEDVKGDDDEDEPHPGNQKKAAETGDLAKVVAELAAVVKAMNDQPAERKVAARVVTKGEDADDDKDKVKKVTPITSSNGDRDADPDSKKDLYKGIYANPMTDAPLAGRKAAV